MKIESGIKLTPRHRKKGKWFNVVGKMKWNDSIVVSSLKDVSSVSHEIKKQPEANAVYRTLEDGTFRVWKTRNY